MRTRIESANIPADLLPRVERFAELLEERLEVLQSFEIEAVLSAAPAHLERSVLLQMGVRDDEGVMRRDHDSCLTPDNLEGTDEFLLRLASQIVSRFAAHLLKVEGENIRHMRERLRQPEPATVEA